MHTDLRVSVTDRCNIRCFYCMPEKGMAFRSHDEILRFEEIERFVRVVARLGIRKVRLTGGEPLVRKNICRLVQMLSAVPGIEDLALTTNGILLPRHAADLKAAGLGRLNISLDTLDREKFIEITHRDELPRVLEGIAAAREAGFRRIKLNALAIAGLTEKEAVPLARFARRHDLELRFIEFMPLDADRRWANGRVLPGRKILDILTREIAPLQRVSPSDQQAPAAQYQFADGLGRIGLINTVTQHFCGQCNRLRLTAEGQVRNCLFSTREWDARAVLRGGADDDALASLVRAAVGEKKLGHGSDNGEFARPKRTMHQIGG